GGGVIPGSSAGVARARQRYEINGRALQRVQYEQRLAQQQGRGAGLLQVKDRACATASCDATAGGAGAAPGPASGADAGAGAGAALGNLRAERSAGRGEGERGGGEESREDGFSGLRPLPVLVDALVSDHERGALLKFETLFAKTWTAKTAAVDIDGSSGRRLEIDVFDPCLVAPEDEFFGDNGGAGGGGGGCGGELVRALEALPQRMADLEELATTDGLHHEAESLAEQCCKTMAVIGAKLRAAHVLATPRSPGAASFSSRTGSQEQPQQQQQASRSGSVLVAAAVRRVAEACAPGRGGCGGNSDGDDDGGDSNGGGRGFPGLSLTTASALLLRAEKKTGRSGGSSAKGSTALVGACAALHVHLLEWLSLVVVSQEEEDDGGRGVRVSLPPLTTGPAAAA
ncbi:unnamed protein product, partial [Pylaiella littoralis]